MSNRRKRGRPIKVPAWWLEQVSDYKEQSGKTLKGLGEELGILLSTERPIHPASVFEYLQGKSTTLEMTQAFATLMGTTMPDIADSNDDLLRRLVDALESHEKRR
jgi:hypothetical protein